MSEASKKITRQELFEAVWSKPIKSLAREWNTTYLRVVEACLEMDVPRPGQGHWQTIALGRTVERDPLPERTGEVRHEVELLPQGSHRERKRAPLASTAAASAANTAAETPKSAAPAEVEGKAPTPKDGGHECDLPRAAEQAVLDMIRQAIHLDFWRASISESHHLWSLASWLRLDAGAKAPEGRLLSTLKNVRKDYRSFQVKVEETKDRYNPSAIQLSVEIALRDGSEWKDAWEEAWTFAETPNPHCLSDNALRLYQWAKGPKNTGSMTKQNKIGAQAGLRKTYSHIEDHLQEIQIKADSSLQWEKETNDWRGSIRVWFGAQESVYYHHGPLNPAMGLNLKEVEHSELERFKNWLHAEVLKPGFPEGTETVGIFDIRDRKTLTAAFRVLPENCGKYGSQWEFFDDLRLVDGLEILHGIADCSGAWLVTCRPEKGVTWKEIKDRLATKADEIPLEKSYTLSADSRALLKWILDLRSQEYLQGMTPPVDEDLSKDVGIEVEWDEKNVRSYLELLVEEINEKTEFNLKTIAWHHYSDELTRILVKKKQADMEGVVRAVQVLGLSRNRLLDGDTIRAAIQGMLDA